jgi:hypothetical protein
MLINISDMSIALVLNKSLFKLLNFVEMGQNSSGYEWSPFEHHFVQMSLALLQKDSYSTRTKNKVFCEIGIK